MRTIKVVAASFVAFAALAVLAFEYILPAVVERDLKARLRASGYPDARFEVGVALDRVKLVDVSLGPGVELGDVELLASPWQLWRGARPDVVVHGPRIDARMLALGPAHGSLPIGRVAIVDGKLDSLAVDGSIDLRTSSVDLVAHASSLRVGPFDVTNLAATVRGPIAALRVCATAELAATQIDACANVRDGVIDGEVRATSAEQRIGSLAIAGATLHAQLGGSPDRLVVRGDARATELTNERVTLREAHVPFDFVVAGDTLRSEQPLVLTATSATVSAGGASVRVDAPTITARGHTQFVTLGSLDPLELVATLHDLPIDRILAAATRDRVRGSGTLDGELVFDAKLALVGGSLAARGPGKLRVRDLPATFDALALHHRIAAALRDFDYTKLALNVAADPDLKLSLAGRGHRVPQEIAIDVNVRYR